MPGIRLNPAKAQTNIVIFDVRETGLSSAEFLAESARRGVLGVPVDRDKIRMVTHLDVSRAEVERAAAAIGDLAESLSSSRAPAARKSV
jgi:threonine aldolase